MDMWSDHQSTTTIKRAGRFAPTPTGDLHVGNGYSALLAVVSARASGLRCILRVDDLDQVRVAARDYTQSQLRDLHWLGLTFDEGSEEGGPAAPYHQAQRSFIYESALAYLNERGLIYPCYCSRKEVIAAAPHAQDEGRVYPQTCRPRAPQRLDLDAVRRTQRRGRLPALRLNVGAITLSTDWSSSGLSSSDDGSLGGRVMTYHDLVYGEQRAHLDDHIGDFVLQRRDGVYGYQLACAVDDYQQGCALVARGADLITSTHRQRLILAALGLSQPQSPQYAHAGLVVDERGERLAKRNQSTSLSGLREAGVPASHVRASLSRILGGPDTDDVDNMVKSFSWDQVSSGPVSWRLSSP